MSNDPLAVMTVFGTRPEAIKMAPVVRHLRSVPGLDSRVAVSGQHRELLDQVLDHFAIKPDLDLNIMTPRQTLTEITTRSLSGFESGFQTWRPGLVLVHGDTTTTLAASLAAFYGRIPIGHVEAGLRTGDPHRPYPEEMNRRLVGTLADLHFAPTQTARGNLLAGGVDPVSVFVTGNTVIDALLLTVDQSHRFRSHTIDAAVRSQARIIVVDVHRRENFGQPMEEIVAALRDIAQRFDDVLLIVSVHPNPETVAPMSHLEGCPRVILHDPLPYPDWVNLLHRAYLYLGDSGGAQEEAPALGTPVVLARDVTERPEAIEAGTVVLAGRDRDRIVATCSRLLEDEADYAKMAQARNPYGDGHASERIAQAILHWSTGTPRPADFAP